MRRLLFVIGLPMGGFDPARYQRQLVDNTDFRKFDDGLRMTVDCSTTTVDAIEARLAVAEQAGVCRYGTHRQKAANLTCIVPSRIGAGHVHFVDDALGGYSAAAAKAQSQEHCEDVARKKCHHGSTMTWRRTALPMAGPFAPQKQNGLAGNTIFAASIVM